MKKYKHKRVVFLLHMLFIASFLIVTPLTSSWAGIETLPFTEDEEDCKPLLEYVGEAIEDKWWEKPLDSVLTASVQVGNTVFESVAAGAEKLMIVGMGLWLALFTMKVVGSMTESDPMENLTKIGGMMVKVGFASWFLHHRDWFFEYFIATVVQTGAAFVNMDQIEGTIQTNKPDSLWSAVQQYFTGAKEMQTKTFAAFSTGKGGLDSAAAALKSIATSIHFSLANVIGKSNFLSCIGEIHKVDVPIIPTFTVTDPKVWASSCAIWAGAQLFMFAFPFFLIDACFRLGVVAALSPLFIIAWVFPATKGFAGKGWSALLNIAFTFMMIRISALIAVKLLLGGSGLEDMEDTPESKTLYVCIFRWFNLGGDDVCEPYKDQIPETNSLFVYLVCVVYGLMLMKNANQLAGFFAGASFSDDTAFQAAKGAGKITGRALSDGIKVAGAAKDRIQAHKDRKAARTYERDQRARQAAANGGPAYNPSKRDQARVDKAKKRLQSKRVGALTKDGKENGEVMAKLLENSRARKAMNIASRMGGTWLHNRTVGKWADKLGGSLERNSDDLAANGSNKAQRFFGRVGSRIGNNIRHNFGKSDGFANLGSTYTERTDAELQSLKSVSVGGRGGPSGGAGNGNGSSSGSSTPSRPSSSTSTPTPTSSASSKPLDGSSVSKLADQVSFRSKGNANYYQANSEEAAAAKRVNDVKRNALRNAGMRRDDVRAKDVQNAAVDKYLKTHEGQKDARTLQNAMNAADQHEGRTPSANTNTGSGGGNASSSNSPTPQQGSQQTWQSQAETLSDVADQYEQNIANHQYANTPEGQAQKTYDQIRSEQVREDSEMAKKRAADPNYDNTPEGQQANQRMQNTIDTLETIREEYNVNDDLLKSAWDTVNKKQN